LGILGHVVEFVLFFGQRHFKDAFGLPDQRQSTPDFLPVPRIGVRQAR
jgi:hypothetical protein